MVSVNERGLTVYSERKILVINKVTNLSIYSNKPNNENSPMTKAVMENIQKILFNNSFQKIGSYFLFDKKMIGKGSYGQVNFGLRVTQKKENIIFSPVAIKKQTHVENDMFGENINFLNIEMRVMDELKKTSNIFPKCLESLKINFDYYIVENLLGPNVLKLYEFCDCNFSPKTICNLGIQLLENMKEIHDKGYLYLDLKEDNISLLLDTIKNKNNDINISLIDFGFCVKYTDDEGNHLPEKRCKVRIGNTYYSSINALEGKPVSRKDDLVMLCYLLLNLYKKLPWAYCRINRHDKKYKEEIIKMKYSFDENKYKELREVLEIMRNIDDLKFEEKPNYEKYKQLLIKCKERNKRINYYEENKYNFDWENKLIEMRKKK